ncbi:MAG: GTP diphosphokinase [Pseudomonadota bacterium]
MVHMHTALPQHNDGSIDIDKWIDRLNIDPQSRPLIQDAYHLAQIAGEDKLTPFNINCLEQGLQTADILAQLQFDPESIATAIIYNAFTCTDLELDEITEQLGSNVAKLTQNAAQMNAIDKSRHTVATEHLEQIDNIRKMLLAMVQDVRAIVIKLADRLVTMRMIRHEPTRIKKQAAQETLNIFAPLANRLGLHQIKWELEDLSYFYLAPKEYLEIAKNIKERRTDRNNRVDEFVAILQTALKEANISAKIYGRAKHIYSIKRKMQRKKLPITEIYDIHAVRILVSTVDECYKVLSIVDGLFTSIPKEFDDYVAHPKPNGYRSIHTAVLGPDGKNFEIQIRTEQMDKEAEMGLAAHWIYKEGTKQKPTYEDKITWLRYLLDWQKGLAHDKNLPKEMEKKILEDRVYVFTPAGDIIDLPIGSTPLDFAYHIHTDIGHRCRGAKINKKIVPLPQPLKTGDQIEILTTKKGGPSRDWLSVQRGYLKTSTARAKVLQWFKQQNHDTHVAEGKAMLDRELQRLNIDNLNLNEIAHKLNYKSSDQMLAGLGNGQLRLSRLTNMVPSDLVDHISQKSSELPAIKPRARTTKSKKNIMIYGIGDLLSQIAQCCRPLPGDPIIGYITAGHGVTIHHRDCKNIAATDNAHTNRLIEVHWGDKTAITYPVDIEILAYDRPNLLRDITASIANQEVNMSQLQTFINNKKHEARFIITIDIVHLDRLTTILDHIQQIPNIHTIRRLHHD